MKKHEVEVCIVGGGPAGMVLGLLLAHQGIKTLVLEKNPSFAREYRGEVLMPRFSQCFTQIGLSEWLLTLVHLKLSHGEIFFKDRYVGKLDFSRVCPEFPYALWMPQVVLLEGLYAKARPYPSFDLWFGAAMKSLVKNADGQTSGVIVQRGGEEFAVSARVTVGADGRWSSVVKDGGFEIEYQDYKFDVLWFTIPKPAGYHNTFKVLLSTQHSYLLLPKHPDSIQAGILVQPHEIAKMREEGIDAIKKELKAAAPIFSEFADSMTNFSAFHPLQAHLHYMKEWAKDGCLLIGDAAHCCSPAGAIGVSMAVGTAIVAADLLARELPKSSGILAKETLSKVQAIRDKDVRNVHRLQRLLTGGPLTTFLPARLLLPIIVSFLARTPFFARFQRQLMMLPEPMTIGPGLRISE